MPSVTVAPNGYFVVQTEIAPTGALLVVWHLDRDLRPDPAPFSVLPKSVAGTAPPPGFVRVDGNRVLVFADDLIAEYDLGGSQVRLTRTAFAASEAYFAAGGMLVAAGVNAVAPVVRCSIGSCLIVAARFDVFLGFDGGDPIIISYPFYSPNGVAAAGDGATMLYAFVDGLDRMAFLRFDTLGRQQIDFTPQPFTLSFINDSPQRPSVATDGTRFLVAWRTPANGRHAIGAAAIERDGSVTPIAIPNLADETQPFVIAAGPNRFLVSYLSRTGNGSRLAGRFITFGGRRLAAGR